MTLSGALAGILIWLSREWISTRLRGSIQHEYDQKLEAHKARLQAEKDVALLELKTSLEREAALHAATHASFTEGQQAAIERRLSAIDKLWGKVLHIRGNLPPILTFIDVLTVDEYKAAKDHPTFQQLAGELSLKKIANMHDSIENVRPYVGEYLWAIFFAYQAILLRLLFLLHLGRDDAAKIEWHKDQGIRQLMKSVLTVGEMEKFDQTKFGKVSWVQELLESKILDSSRKVISGEEFGAESFEQAKVIQQLATQINAKSKPR